MLRKRGLSSRRLKFQSNGSIDGQLLSIEMEALGVRFAVTPPLKLAPWYLDRPAHTFANHVLTNVRPFLGQGRCPAEAFSGRYLLWIFTGSVLLNTSMV